MPLKKDDLVLATKEEDAIKQRQKVEVNNSIDVNESSGKSPN